MAIRVTHGASPILTGLGAFAGGLAGGLERRRREQAQFDLAEETRAGALERDRRRADEQRGILQMRFQEERDVETREAYWDRREEDRKSWEAGHEFEPQDQMEYTENENRIRSVQSATGITEDEKQPTLERLERKGQQLRKRGRKKKTGAELAAEKTFAMEGMRGRYQFDDKGVLRPVEEPKIQKEDKKPLPPTIEAYRQQLGPVDYDKAIDVHRKAMGKTPDTADSPSREHTYDEAEADFKKKHFPDLKYDPSLLQFGDFPIPAKKGIGPEVLGFSASQPGGKFKRPKYQGPELPPEIRQQGEELFAALQRAESEGDEREIIKLQRALQEFREQYMGGAING